VNFPEVPVPLEYSIVDVFADRPLEGNPVAVFSDGSGLDAQQMQALAREMNLSESVFLLPPEGEGHARLRIFTPWMELPFAGHPVLGSACLVARNLSEDTVRLETGAGTVPVILQRRAREVSFGRMRQPIPTWAPYPRAAELLVALGIAGSLLPVEAYRNGPDHVYVELPDEDAVAALAPDIGALADFEGVGANCFAGAGRRWKTRMFGPGLGVVEDPATGSAAGPLAVHLARHGRIAFGEEIEIRQGAEIGRPSLLYARASGSPDAIESVEVAGAAVIVAEGRFLRW
jgi:trans-2,3-dihydro-3-hydroxyanthranilate isomerase